MTEVKTHEFIETICSDFNINPEKEIVLKLPADKKVIKRFTSGRSGLIRIFDGCREHPYMLTLAPPIRNEEKMKSAVELRQKVSKTITEIEDECGLVLQKSRAKISEGNGWYSWGVKFIYKKIYCEN